MTHQLRGEHLDTLRMMRAVQRTAVHVGLGRGLGAVNRLGTIVRLYGGTDKDLHGYTPFYETHLGPRRLRTQLVFEIGVGGYAARRPGGSLAVWRDYLIRSTIVGLDIHPKDISLGKRVRFEQADQKDVDDLQRVIDRHGRPDVVIDDGSHIAAHINTSFEFLWPMLQSGGMYVIEDLSTSYYPSYGGGDPPQPSTAMGLLERLSDSVQAQDSTFARHPEWGSRSAPAFASVAAVHVYPGIAFIFKSRY